MIIAASAAMASFEVCAHHHGATTSKLSLYHAPRWTRSPSSATSMPSKRYSPWTVSAGMWLFQVAVVQPGGLTA